MFNPKLKRGPQIITPKDCSLILAYSNIAPGSKVVDAGTGSGFLAIFLGTYLRPGKVYTYENDDRSISVAKENIKTSGLEGVVVLKKADVTKGIKEKGVDLVTLDLKDASKALAHAHKALKPGGIVSVYSPNVEHLLGSIKALKKAGFLDIKTVENIVREWKADFTTRPETMGLMHTGFITFARKEMSLVKPKSGRKI
jgi:tRNA (adenine57-N1/adenine58-N1)-methyltransferase catalytic subunit